MSNPCVVGLTSVLYHHIETDGTMKIACVQPLRLRVGCNEDGSKALWEHLDGFVWIRDVGSISRGGGTTLRGHFFLKKKGAFFKVKRALLCLLQNLGGVRAPSAPRFLRLWCGSVQKIERRAARCGGFHAM